MELFTPDSGLVIWMFIAFAVLFIVLYIWGWPVIINNMESRADTIDKGVEDAKKASEQLANARAEASRYMEEAKKQQAEILSDAAKMKNQIIEEAREEASREAKKVMDAAKLSIDQSRKEAELQFKNEVGKMALEIAEKVLRTNLESDKAQSNLVNKLLDNIEKN